MRLTILIAIAAASTCPRASAMAPFQGSLSERVSAIDKDSNGVIEPGPEEQALLTLLAQVRVQHRAPSGLDLFDAKKLNELAKDVVGSRLLAEIDFDEARGTRSGIPVPEVLRDLTAPLVSSTSFLGFKLRGSLERASALESVKALSRAESAELSYLRNTGDGDEVFTAKGSIFRHYRRDRKSSVGDCFGLSSTSWTPSFTFDRVHNADDATKEVDSALVRLHREWEFLQNSTVLSGFYARIGLAYGTDFDLDRSLAAVEIEVEPLSPRLAIGSAGGIGGALDVRWRPILRAEFGETYDVGDSTELKSGGFARLGGKVAIEAWPTSEMFDRVTLRVDGARLLAVDGDANSVSYFEASAAFRLDANGQVELKGSYRNGNSELTLDDTELITIGLGIKL